MCKSCVVITEHHFFFFFCPMNQSFKVRKNCSFPSYHLPPETIEIRLLKVFSWCCYHDAAAVEIRLYPTPMETNLFHPRYQIEIILLKLADIFRNSSPGHTLVLENKVGNLYPISKQDS